MQIRREGYYWVLEKLDLYKPIVWEYSRLNLSHTIVSKRTLKAIVNEGYVRGWDDPRMPTLMALRRRGFSAGAIRAFCDKLGVSASDNSNIPYEWLEDSVRDDLNEHARRTFVVMDPLRVVITNQPADFAETVSAPDFPADKTRGFHSMPLTYVHMSAVLLSAFSSFSFSLSLSLSCIFLSLYVCAWSAADGAGLQACAVH